MSKFHRKNIFAKIRIVEVRSIYSGIWHLKLGFPLGATNRLPSNMCNVYQWMYQLFNTQCSNAPRSTLYTHCYNVQYNVQYLFGASFNLVYDRLDYKQTPNGSWKIENREFHFLYRFVTGAHYCVSKKFNNKKRNASTTKRNKMEWHRGSSSEMDHSMWCEKLIDTFRTVMKRICVMWCTWHRLWWMTISGW